MATICPHCGKENPYNSAFCPLCGKSMGPRPAPPKPAAPAAEVQQALQAALEREETARAPVVTDEPPPPRAAPRAVTLDPAPPPSAPSTLNPLPPPAAPPVVVPPPPAAPPPSAAFRSVSSVFVVAQNTSAPRANQQAPAGAPTQCPVCHAAVTPGVRFCSHCGTKVDASAPPPSASARAAAAIKQTQFLSAFQVRDALKNKNRLVIMDASGAEGMQYSLNAAQTLCGRVNGMIILDDPAVSPTHCMFRFMDDVLSVEDAGSLNGVYLKLRGDVALSPGDSFRIGGRVIRVEAADSLALTPTARAEGDDAELLGTPTKSSPAARFVEQLANGAAGDSLVMRGKEMVFGKDGTDFPVHDDAVSQRHCAVSDQAGLLLLRDVGSLNGTWVRLREEQKLEDGDILLVGNHRMRVDLKK